MVIRLLLLSLPVLAPSLPAQPAPVATLPRSTADASGISTAAPIDWPADLTTFQRELPARHKNLFFSVDRSTFDGRIDALRAELAQLSNLTIALRLQEIAVAMGDDHSGVDCFAFASSEPAIPIGIRWFSDGWRVLSIDPPHASLVGQKLLAIGGVPMAEVERRCARLLSRDNPWLVKQRLPLFVGLAGVLRHLGLAGTDAALVSTVDDDGAPSETRLSFLPRTQAAAIKHIEFKPKATPYGLANQRPWWRGRLLPEDRIFYIHYNRCDGREAAERRGDAAAAQLPSLAEGFARMATAIRTALAEGKADKVVFDVQFNPGGASEFGTRFAQELKSIEMLREPGRVFVVIGRSTFSSAIINALDFKQLLGAIVVGEPTSGTPNHYGEVRQFMLPSSGARVFFSTKVFRRVDGGFEPLRPDIPAEMSFADFAAGIDPALEAIKHYAIGAGPVRFPPEPAAKAIHP